MESTKFDVNQQANLADIGTMVSEALFAFSDRDSDSVRDNLLEIHGMIYPNASEQVPTRADAAEFLEKAEPAPWLFGAGEDGKPEQSDMSNGFAEKYSNQDQLPSWVLSREFM
jgi:hypothetical protein